jgi:uncharacterized protein (DUF362 family)
MSRDERHRHLITRRHFIRRSGTLGAGVALGPLVLDLSACASDQPGAAPGGANNPSTAMAAPASGAAGTTSASAGAESSSGTGGSTVTAAAGSGGSNSNRKTTDAGAGGNVMAQAQGGSPSAGAGGSGDAAGASASAGSGATASNPNAIAANAVLLGLYAQGDGAAAVAEAAKKLDFSWLKPGDSVLIKVATNSQYKHPTTTSVPGVKGMVKELKARGAGKVIVADQAGVEHVRLTSKGRYGSTKDMWSMNTMDTVAPDAELHYFDDQPFDTGYFMATLPDGHHWPRGMYIPSVIKQVDHIIYMPRIGVHILAGNTIAHKSAIGWLRDDSRHDLHNDAMNYYEKYTDINYTQEIRDRFRMVVTVSEAILLHGGPDTGTNYALEPVLVTASTSMANHDALASSILVTLNKNVTTVDPGTMTYSASSAPQNNAFFANGAGVPTGDAGPWTSGSMQTMYTAHPFEMGVTKDRAISRGWEIAGGKPSSISVVLDGSRLDDTWKSGMMTHGEGLYQLA